MEIIFMKIKLSRKRNPVAKNMNKFNKAVTMRDRKNDYQRNIKFKKNIEEE